jgi:hypothetical protein
MHRDNRNYYDAITNQDDLILDIKVQRANQPQPHPHRMQSQSNNNSYVDMHHKPKLKPIANLPRLTNNIHRHEPDFGQGSSSKSNY